MTRGSFMGADGEQGFFLFHPLPHPDTRPTHRVFVPAPVPDGAPLGRRQGEVLRVVRREDGVEASDGHLAPLRDRHGADVGQRLEDRLGEVRDEDLVGVERGDAAPLLDAGLLG